MGLFDFLYSGDTNANNGKTPAELDAEGRALTKKKQSEETAWQLYAESEGIDSTGRYTQPEVMAQYEEHYNAQESQDANIGQQLDEEGNAEFFRQVGKRRDEASGVIGGTFKTLTGIIPWQVWVLGLLAIAFLVWQNTGGLGRLIGKKL